MYRFLLLAGLSAIIMISYEFIVGLIMKFGLKQEVPWVYVRFTDHKFRSISAFTMYYFLAWFILGIIHVYILEQF